MTVFVINDTEFGWEEIVAAAQGWGEWQPFMEEARQVLSCLRYAVERHQLPAAGEVRGAATAFRYAHNLISAEEAQAWLQRWEMTADVWMNWLRGRLLRETWVGRLDEIVAACPVSEEAEAEVLKPYAVCADKFGEWAVRLAGHAAIAAASGCFDVAKDSESRSPRDLVARIEAEFGRQQQRILTPKLIDAKIADHRLDWIRFDCRSLWFAAEPAAREAVFCVVEDGLTLEEVAAAAHADLRQCCFYLDEIEAGVRPYFLAARPGETLGPLKLQEGFPLFSIVDKRMPAADDPQIRARAERAILSGVMQQAMNERVKWVTI